MKKKQCLHEARVLSELVRERPAEEVGHHLQEYPVCRDSALIHHWMEKLRNGKNLDGPFEPGIPDFESIWEKAGRAPVINRELEKRALLPLLVPRVLSAILLLTGMVLLATTKSSSVTAFFYSDLKMGLLYHILRLLGNKLLDLLPYILIPPGFMLIVLADCFLFSRFHPGKA